MAIVSVYRKGETKVINGQTTDQNGSFVIDNLPVGEYQITVDFISYKKASYNAIKVSSGSVNLGNVSLAPSSNQLDEVKIVSKTQTIQNKIDKMVYNCEWF